MYICVCACVRVCACQNFLQNDKTRMKCKWIVLILDNFGVERFKLELFIYSNTDTFFTVMSLQVSITHDLGKVNKLIVITFMRQCYNIHKYVNKNKYTDPHILRSPRRLTFIMGVSFVSSLLLYIDRTVSLKVK